MITKKEKAFNCDDSEYRAWGLGKNMKYEEY